MAHFPAPFPQCHKDKNIFHPLPECSGSAETVHTFSRSTFHLDWPILRSHDRIVWKCLPSTLSTFSLPPLLTLTLPRNQRFNTVLKWLGKETSRIPSSNLFLQISFQATFIEMPKFAKSDTPHDQRGWASPEQTLSSGWAGWAGWAGRVPPTWSSLSAHLSTTLFPTHLSSVPAISRQLSYAVGLLFLRWKWFKLGWLWMWVGPLL